MSRVRNVLQPRYNLSLRSSSPIMPFGGFSMIEIMRIKSGLYTPNDTLEWDRDVPGLEPIELGKPRYEPVMVDGVIQYDDKTHKPIERTIIFEKGVYSALFSDAVRGIITMLRNQRYAQVPAKFYNNGLWAWSPDMMGHDGFDQVIHREGKQAIFGAGAKGQLQISNHGSRKFDFATSYPETLEQLMHLLAPLQSELSLLSAQILSPGFHKEGLFGVLYKDYLHRK